MVEALDNSQEIYEEINPFFPAGSAFSNYLKLCDEAVEALKEAAAGEETGFLIFFQRNLLNQQTST